MKIFIIVSLLFCQYVFADSLSTELIFGDSYTGYFKVSPNNQDGYLTVVGYAHPNLSSKIAEPISLPVGCIEGGGDCDSGTPYITEQTDSAGNVFYLVNSQDKTRVWILQPINTEKLPMDIHVGSGASSLLEPEDAALSDTSKEDGVPNVSLQQIIAIKAFNRVATPDLGTLEIFLQNNNADIDIPVWLSNERPGTENNKLLNLRLLQTGNSTNPNVNVLRKKGKYLLVLANTFVETITTGNRSPTGDISIFWIDTSKLKTRYSPTIVSPETSPSFGYINPLMAASSEHVVKIKIFNGNAYAFIETLINLFDPDQFSLDENQFKTKRFSFPAGWKKIRDEKGRLLIWFQHESGC